jgi:Icc-related predicted phosphoesterase
MRQILICSGVHSRPKSLSWLRQVVERRHPDAILFSGGILDLAGHLGADGSRVPGSARFIEHFFETLGSLGVFCAVVPGPHDAPWDDFLRLGMHAEIEFPNVHLAHASLIEKADAVICGMGGAIGQTAAPDRHACSRTVAEYHLRSLWTAKQPYKVLMFAEPPAGALGGDLGNALVADLIDSLHPSLCVVSGPNEHRGSLRVASTLVINPGYVAEGQAIWLDRTRPADDQVQLVNLRDLDQAAMAADVGYGD